jgi:hypothetical protein
MRPEQIKQLDELQAAAAAQGEVLYALIDCGATEELFKTLKAPLQRGGIGLFEHTPDAALKQLGPWLIAHEAIRDHYRMIAKVRPLSRIVTWLQSPLSTTELANHLRPALAAEIEGGASALVRFFDPDVLAGYLALLPTGTRSALLSPISRWWACTAETLDAVHSAPAQATATTYQVQLDEAQYFALRQIALPRQLHPILCSELAQRFQEPLTHAQRSVIWQQVLAATAAGFRRQDDITYWCLIAFGVGDQLGEDTHFKQAIETALDRNIPLGEAASGITEEQWNAMGSSAQVQDRT